MDTDTNGSPVTTGMIVEIVLAVVLAVLLVLLLVVLRRVQQLRRGGVDVAARPVRVGAVDDGRGWHTGIGRYRGDQFRWYRVGGLRSSPSMVLDRTVLEIVDRREPRPEELSAPGSTVLLCRAGERSWELAMSPDVLTGFSSWLEATPPGRTTGYRQSA